MKDAGVEKKEWYARTHPGGVLSDLHGSLEDVNRELHVGGNEVLVATCMTMKWLHLEREMARTYREEVQRSIGC